MIQIDPTNLRSLILAARDTLTAPRQGARAALSLDLPRNALWLLFAIVVVVSMVLAQAVTLLMPIPEGLTSEEASLLFSPVALGLVQAMLLFLVTHGIDKIGRIFGGQGSFDGALAVMIWLQFIFICLQVIQLVFIIIMLPAIADIIGILAFALFFWLLANFIAELHGFQSTGQVFVMIIVTLIALAFALTLVFTILGIGLGVN